MALEIEKKYLLREFPGSLIESGELRVDSTLQIDQTYLALSGDEELRVRRIVDEATGAVSFTHTYKKGFGLVREELEIDISEGLYEKLMSEVSLKPLVKQRVKATLVEEKLSLEIDSYELRNLQVAEVEFASEADAEQFIPPAWFGEEITSDKRYSNKAMWRELNGR